MIWREEKRDKRMRNKVMNLKRKEREIHCIEMSCTYPILRLVIEVFLISASEMNLAPSDPILLPSCWWSVHIRDGEIRNNMKEKWFDGREDGIKIDEKQNDGLEEEREKYTVLKCHARTWDWDRLSRCSWPVRLKWILHPLIRYCSSFMLVKCAHPRWREICNINTVWWGGKMGIKIDEKKGKLSSQWLFNKMNPLTMEIWRRRRRSWLMKKPPTRDEKSSFLFPTHPRSTTLMVQSSRERKRETANAPLSPSSSLLIAGWWWWW